MSQGTGDGTKAATTPPIGKGTIIAGAIAFATWFPGWLNTSGLLEPSQHLDKRLVAGLNFVAGVCAIITAVLAGAAVRTVDQKAKAVATTVADHIDPVKPTSDAQTAETLREVAGTGSGQ